MAYFIPEIGRRLAGKVNDLHDLFLGEDTGASRAGPVRKNLPDLIGKFVRGGFLDFPQMGKCFKEAAAPGAHAVIVHVQPGGYFLVCKSFACH